MITLKFLNAHILLYLLAVFAKSAKSCPPEEEISPCVCLEDEDSASIVVTCARPDTTLKDLQRALGSLKKIDRREVHVELDGLRLVSLPSDTFEGLHIETLEISHCDLDRLGERNGCVLSGLEDSLQVLSIVSSFKEVDLRLNLSCLRRLTDLSLSENVFTELGNDWLGHGIRSLQYLTLANNGILKLGDAAFADLTQLRVLTLNGNRFGPISRSMLPAKADELVTLTLENNALTSIPVNLFSDLPSLSAVSLRENGIARLEQKTWKPVWQQLDAIYLEDNPLRCDSHMVWMFQFRMTSAIYGRCEFPTKIAGMDLQEFIDRRGL